MNLSQSKEINNEQLLAQVQEGLYLGGEQVVDLLVTERVTGDTLRTAVQCVATRQGRADEAMVGRLIGWLPAAKAQNKIDRGLVVCDRALAPAAHGQLEGAGWKVRTYDDLLAGAIDFSFYLDHLRADFSERRNDSALPALATYYVPVKVRHEVGSEDEKPLDLFAHVIKWIEAPSPVKPLMLLGEYGTGKTTFSRMLACELARRYLAHQDDLAAGKPVPAQRPRLPLLINLLDFVEIRKIDSLIIHYLDARCGVDRPRYELFEARNQAGHFVIILDGFDEMAVRVDSTTIEKHLVQMERLARLPNSRVILTGRPEFFMSREEMEQALWRHRQLLSSRFVNFEALRLQLWDNDQIKAFLEGLVPHLRHEETGPAASEHLRTAADYFQRIQEIPGFDDLAQRAVLLEMIAQTLHLFGSHEQITRPNLYERYLRRELYRQRVIKQRELLLEDETRFELLQQLAADSYLREGGGIQRGQAELLVKPKLPAEEQSSASKTEHHTREFLGCSFLRPGPGDLFVFSHRSFRGYLAAKELLPQLLADTAKPQPIDQDCIGFLAEILQESCTPDWYRQQVVAALQRDGLPDWIKRKAEGTYVSELPSGLPVEMVYVPPGPYVLGAEEGEYALPPQIAVLEKGFWIDKTPVTNEQYQHFLAANPKHREPVVKSDWARPYNWRNRRFPQGQGDHPVVLVDWNEAQAFCRWTGKVLPEEKQWEKAARGLDGRRWPWGSTWDRDKCNSASWWAKRDLWDYEKEWQKWRDEEFNKKHMGKTVMTTSSARFGESLSPYGCLDCAGNVWEWCADLWSVESKNRVVRGGAWLNLPPNLACAYRGHSEPGGRYGDLGFRGSRT